MGRLSCRCLNVSVHYKGPSWASRPLTGSRLFPEGSRDRLAAETVYEIELDVAGVTSSQKALVVTRTVGDWVIFTCSNCNTDVYILHAMKDYRIFVTKTLVSDPGAIQSLSSHEDFSAVFRMILRERGEEEEEFQRKRISSMSFGREDPVMKLIHTRMKSYLSVEEAAMEDRVRRFEAEQRDAFSQLQKRAHKDRTLLFEAIQRARENVISDAISDAAKSPPPTRHSEETPPTRTTPPSRRSPRASPDQKNVTITLTDRRPPPTKPLTSGGQLDDALFSLDGFEEEGVEEQDGTGGVAFPQSDDEDISTDDSSYRDVSTLAIPGLATSVPISVPMFLPTTKSQNTTSGEAHFDPDEVRSSMKALALSVQDTGLFGDLPKPRLSSAPFAR